MISEDVYWFLDEMDLLPEEQKGARKGSRGTHGLVFIDKMILQSARNGKMDLFMAWIDYRKAYDMLPHSWIKESLDWFGVASNVKNLLFKSMEQWRTELHAMSTPIGKSRSIECAKLVVRRRKVSEAEGIKLPDGRERRNLEEGTSYKYLGILEAGEFQRGKMKKNLTKEYLGRVRKLLQSKLDGRHLISGIIKTWAVSAMKYSASFISWTQEELGVLDRRTRKYLNMYNALHLRESVARLYLRRKIGGRGLISIADCVDQASIGLANYTAESNERLLTAARRGTSTRQEDSKEFKKRKREERMKEVREKQLHGQFLREMDGMASDKSWEWLEKGHIKRHTEGLIMAAQSQSVRANAIKAKNEKSQDDSRCRLCKKTNETVNHLLSECPKLAQSEYKRRHDNVTKGIHWDICKQLGMECGDKWYNHNPEPVTENEDRKILWDLTIQTDKRLPHNRLDIVVIDKAKKECHIIDVACPGDSRIALKEEEKIDRYRDLAIEIEASWRLKKVLIVP
ncbi:uncharacterized protein [Montipora capricornis]|uniref:uncharacterized protein n=1 Tax=Montipora capricornis TaxID=246305 RepID=UPI0035F15043